MLFGGDDHYRSLITGKCEGAAKFAGAAFVLSELVGISCVGMGADYDSISTEIFFSFHKQL
jgi:hypothetical protein